MTPDDLRKLADDYDQVIFVSRAKTSQGIRQAADEIGRLTAENALLRDVAEAAEAWAKESREDLGHDKMNLTWLVQNLAALHAFQAKRDEKEC